MTKEKLYYECNTCHHTWKKQCGGLISVIDYCPKCGEIGYLHKK